PPDPYPGPDLNPDLTSVSCPTEDFCMASGNWADAPWDEPLLPQVQVWDGSTWSMLPFDGPAEGPNMGEGHVTSDCGSPTHCRVLLDIHDDDDHYAMASRWDGAAWTSEVLSLNSLTQYSVEAFDCTDDACLGFDEDGWTFLELLEGGINHVGGYSYLHGMVRDAA